MELIESVERGLLEDWTLAFPPAQVALCALEGGDVIRETSLVAAKVSRKKNTCVVQTYLAAGAAARRDLCRALACHIET